MRTKKVAVEARFDDDAAVWSAWSDDLPGLVAEAADLDSLFDIVRSLIADYLILSGQAREVHAVEKDDSDDEGWDLMVHGSSLQAASVNG